MATNNGTHHLHGGIKGWDKVVWTAEAMDTAEGPALRLAYVSRDGEEGYPGTVAVTCLYTLTWQNELRVAMRATTDAATLVAMAAPQLLEPGRARRGAHHRPRADALRAGLHAG